MGLPIITPSDFSGWIKITANSFKAEDLERYIETFREYYLRDIVGSEAYYDIENTNKQKWNDLINGVSYIDANNKRQYHNGILMPLKCFIYFEFERDNFTSTQTGKVRGKAENSNRLSGVAAMGAATNRFNIGSRLLNTTCDFIEAFYEISEVSSSSTDNGDNTYTIGMSSSKYLSMGDFVKTGAYTYDVLNVVDNSSITIQASETGLDFAGLTFSWKPFESVEYKKIGIITL